MIKKMKKDFTLAEGADARQIGNKKRLFAFTLAEVLITLMIIGVVAAVTIPTLMNNINNNAMANQRKTVSAKIAEGFNQMRVAGALATTYDDTTAFVNEMKKYFKINAVCKSTELASCFNSTVTTANGEETNEIATMDGVNDVVGLILSDGTSMLIKYDKTADKIEEGQIEKVGYVNDAKGNLQYATYGDLIKYIYDVNGSKSPNKSGTDIMGNLSTAPSAQQFSNEYCLNDTPGISCSSVDCSDIQIAMICAKSCKLLCDANGLPYKLSNNEDVPCYNIQGVGGDMPGTTMCMRDSECSPGCTCKGAQPDDYMPGECSK